MTARLERLLNLVIALREAPRPMSAEEIRERVAGYEQSDHSAFRRMLERDKADLRALGVPVETAPTDRWRDREGYRIDPRAYDLPELALEADEVAALAVALRATGLDEEARGGLRKLLADAGPDAEVDAQRPPVALPLADSRREALAAAVRDRQAVRFAYHPPGRRPDERTVDPWGLVHRGGHWYLVGHDHRRQERRAFRLDRMGSSVTPAGPAGAASAGAVGPADVVPDAPVRAEVAADAAQAWRVARRAQAAGVPGADGRTLFRLRAADAGELLGWLLAGGPGIEVLGPPELRRRQRHALRELLGAHREASA